MPGLARVRYIQDTLSRVCGIQWSDLLLVQRIVEDLVPLQLQGFLPAAEEVDLSPGKGQYLIHGLVDAPGHLLGGIQVVAAHVDDVVRVVLDSDGGSRSIHGLQLGQALHQHHRRDPLLAEDADVLLEVRYLPAGGEVVADRRQGDWDAPARQALRVLEELLEQGAQHQVGERVQRRIDRAGEDEQHGLAVDQVCELQLFRHRHDLLDAPGQHAVHCGHHYAADAGPRVFTVFVVLVPAHEHLRVFIPQCIELVDRTEDPEQVHVLAVVFFNHRRMVNFLDALQDVSHPSLVSVQHLRQPEEASEEVGSTVLPVGIFSRSAAGREDQRLGQPDDVGVFAEVQHGIVPHVRPFRMDQVKHPDVVPPAFEQGAVLVQEAALGQQHRHALVERVEQVGLHHALGLTAAGTGDDQHVIVDLGDVRVHAVRPFRAVPQDQGIVFLFPHRFLP